MSEIINDLEKLPKNETLRLRRLHTGKNCKLFFEKAPLKIVRAAGQYMYDEEGVKYLDCINNVAHVGHCNPKVVEAGQRQMALVSTNNRFLHDELCEFTSRLANTMPAGLDIVYMVNSGSEANDLALRMAWNYTRNKDVLVLDHAYHGCLSSTMEISPYKFRKTGGPHVDWVHVVAQPDPFHGEYRSPNYDDESLSILYSTKVRDVCSQLKSQGRGPAAFIAETLPSCGGQVIPPRGYFEKVYREVRANGGVCIADEVQTGFGRTGHMWAFQYYNVIPDIVVVGKSMGNGHPVAAVVTTKALADSFSNIGVDFFSTYGGNPVSCAIANAVLSCVEEGLAESACQTGARLLEGLKALAVRIPAIGEVRGRGLFIGIDLVKDRLTREPDTDLAETVIGRLRHMGIILSTDGPNANIIKIKPPLTFNNNDADFLVTSLGIVLDELSPSKSPTLDIITEVPMQNTKENLVSAEVESQAGLRNPIKSQ